MVQQLVDDDDHYRTWGKNWGNVNEGQRLSDTKQKQLKEGGILIWEMLCFYPL